MEGRKFKCVNGDVAVIEKYYNSHEIYIYFEGYEGHIIRTRLSHLKSGVIKNRMKPIVAGLGYLGSNNEAKSSHVLYSRWNSMMNRCYNERDPNYHNYGQKGVYVSERWHSFSNYILDVSQMDNYHLLLEDSRNWTVDKDKLSTEERLYSKNTCSIIPLVENTQLSFEGHERIKKGVNQYSKSGKFIKSYSNLAEVVKELGLKNHGNISNCLNGRNKTAYGFMWKYKED